MFIFILVITEQSLISHNECMVPDLDDQQNEWL